MQKIVVECWWIEVCRHMPFNTENYNGCFRSFWKPYISVKSINKLHYLLIIILFLQKINVLFTLLFVLVIQNILNQRKEHWNTDLVIIANICLIKSFLNLQLLLTACLLIIISIFLKLMFIIYLYHCIVKQRLWLEALNPQGC